MDLRTVVSRKNTELVVSGGLVVFSVSLYLYTILQQTGRSGFHGLAPYVYPKITIILIGLVSAASFVKVLLQYRGKEKVEKSPISSMELKPVLVFMLGTLAYIYGIVYIGFYTSSVSALICSMLYLGFRKVITILLVTAVTTGSIYLIFQVGLRIRMTHGVLF